MEKKEVLSEEEIEALTENNDENQSVTTLDFSDQQKVIRAEFLVLERINERFAKMSSRKIYEILSKEVTVDTEDVDIVKYNEFLGKSKEMMSFSLLNALPLRGKAIITLDIDLIYLVIENYYGGIGRKLEKKQENEFSLFESKMIDFLSENLIECLQMAWKPVFDLSFSISDSQLNPQITKVAEDEDMILVSTFKFSIGEEFGKFNVIFPYIMLDPIRDYLDLGSSRSEDELDPSWINSIKKRILDVPLKVSSVFATKIMSVSEISSLKKDQVIFFEKPDEHDLFIEGLPYFKGTFGINNEKNSIQITRKNQLKEE